MAVKKLPLEGLHEGEELPADMQQARTESSRGQEAGGSDWAALHCTLSLLVCAAARLLITKLHVQGCESLPSEVQHMGGMSARGYKGTGGTGSEVQLSTNVTWQSRRV